MERMTLLPDERVTVKIIARRERAPGIVELVVAATGDELLPPVEPGAHVEVSLPDGIVRHYSLLDDGALGHYRLGVLREPESRGGSRFLAEEATIGTRLKLSAPRPLFGLDPATKRALLIAGGIGVTPLLAMARRLRDEGVPFTFHYLVRERGRAAFMEELCDLLPGTDFCLHCSAESGRCDLAALTADVDPDTRVYACGPAGLLEALEDRAETWPAGTLRLERFHGVTEPAAVHGGLGCEVILQRSGHRFTLAPGEPLLDALEREGVAPPSLCREGICGTCAIGVKAGELEHRDLLQSDVEKRANDVVYCCVSRPLGDTLVLDL